jgi:superfamily I DNA/RNA helicase
VTSGFQDDDAIWRRCEVAWSAWLQAAHYAVTHLGEAVGNTLGTPAPLISVGGKRLRAPDLLTTKAGRSEYWEVKFRTRSGLDPLTGDREHWMAYSAFRDYLAVAAGTGCRLWVMLYEAPTSISPGRWLRTDIRNLGDRGRLGSRFGQGGLEVEAWIWPVSAMEVVSGPQVETAKVAVPVLPDEGDQHPLGQAEFEPFERQLRRKRPDPKGPAVDDTPMSDVARVANALDNEAMVGLDVLRRSLGVPSLPRYSILRVGTQGIDLDDLLGLLHYGIRVFLVTASGEENTFDPTELQAFRDSRLLEWAITPDVGEAGFWVVDGQFPERIPAALTEAINAADESGGINIGQYHVVHAPAASDLLVTAGAGTGKTETMSERLVFLLATHEGGEADDSSHPYDLRADDIVLMTFTREAAREMRRRIARTLMLRLRLSRRCVLPALAWLMQLSSAEIATIHTYAKRVAQAGAGAIGLAPNFTVSKQTMSFRGLLYDALSPHLSQLLESYPLTDVPAVHLWQKHIDAIWEALENNGVELMPLAEDRAKAPQIDWGTPLAADLEAAVARTTSDVVNQIAAGFRDFCLDNQSVPTSQLVPVALAAVRAQDEPPVKKPKYLFVDEFQDTDALQMDLMLDIRSRLDATLFVVGDAKQGIYRFRGAEGNAFKELRSRVAERKLTPLKEHRLTRNFRAGTHLLDSLHPYFQEWGAAGFLVYDDSDKLRPQVQQSDMSSDITFRVVRENKFAQEAALQVEQWRNSAPSASIAVLCRRNWQAIKVQSGIREAGGSCELLVGGSFYTTPAVRELRVLLEAVSQPSDDAALLELCETRWAAGLLQGQAPPGVSDAAWESDVAPLVSWHDRFASIATTDWFDRSDLQPLRQRLISLKAMLSRMPVMAWIVECARVFVPEGSSLPGPDDVTERRRYSRCFDYLVTLLDSKFEESPATLEGVLSWLRLQIATNQSEDEPVEWNALKGRTTALTVHKAKGLEFERVLIPNSWTEFSAPKSVATQVTVLRLPGELPRVIWKWSGGTSIGDRFSNVSASDQDLWARDARETAREETRLLYVAMTRAKQELLIFQLSHSAGMGAGPMTWGDLLQLVRR